MLTKEECESAIDRVARLCSYHIPYKEFEHLKLHGELDTLMDLIHEHFDNPPLKFEELKEGMWVWDDRDKEYIMVCRTCVYPKDNFLVRKGDELVFISKDDEEFHRMYRPNRFFRKEVQE